MKRLIHIAVTGVLVVAGCGENIYDVVPYGVALGSGVNRLSVQVEKTSVLGEKYMGGGDDFVVDPATLRVSRTESLEIIGVSDSSHRSYIAGNFHEDHPPLIVRRISSTGRSTRVLDLKGRGKILALGLLEIDGQVSVAAVARREGMTLAEIHIAEEGGRVVSRVPVPENAPDDADWTSVSFCDTALCLVEATRYELDVYQTYVWDRRQGCWIDKHEGNLRVVQLDGSIFGRLNNGRYRLVSPDGIHSEIAPYRRQYYYAIEGSRAFWVWDFNEKDLTILRDDEVPWEM